MYRQACSGSQAYDTVAFLKVLPFPQSSYFIHYAIQHSAALSIRVLQFSPLCGYFLYPGLDL